MKLLITGICGFVGSSLAKYLRADSPDWEIHGLDNFIRPGSERNRLELKRLGIKVRHADLRSASDFETLPAVDAVIDAAANPSVLAGIDGNTSSRQLVEHNLAGTVNLLEYCKAHRSSFLLLSTSRVYSIPPLASLPMTVIDDAFAPDPGRPWPAGVSSEGLDETFSTRAPVSLYGSTKLASEALALEYGEAFGVADADIAATKSWLVSQGFTVHGVYPNKMQIDFSGTAGQVKRAFHTQENRYTINNTTHIANASDIALPAALKDVVVGVAGLNDLHPQAQHIATMGQFNPATHKFKINASATTVAGPQAVNFGGGRARGLAPYDLAKMYAADQLHNRGLTGRGITIAVVGDSGS